MKIIQIYNWSIYSQVKQVYAIVEFHRILWSASVAQESHDYKWEAHYNDKLGAVEAILLDKNISDAQLIDLMDAKNLHKRLIYGGDEDDLDLQLINLLTGKTSLRDSRVS